MSDQILTMILVILLLLTGFAMWEGTQDELAKRTWFIRILGRSGATLAWISAAAIVFSLFLGRSIA